MLFHFLCVNIDCIGIHAKLLFECYIKIQLGQMHIFQIHEEVNQIFNDVLC